MTIIITGVAGLIGSNLSTEMVNKGYRVIGIDNLKLGKLHNIKHLIKKKNFIFKKINLENFENLKKLFKNIIRKNKVSVIWHFAANSDIQKGSKNFDIDYQDTFLTTFNLIKICRIYSINKFYFASSSAIYGDLKNLKLKEDSGPLLPISAYGSSKLSAEAFISCAKESFLKKALIFRFPNVVGRPLTHGVIFDFLKKIKQDPRKLNVLGNGKQKKIYMHVSDLLDAMLFIERKTKNGIHIFNIGPKDKGIFVKDIANKIAIHFGKNTKINYEKKKQGWVGDIPSFHYNTSKLLRLGFKKKISNSDQAINRCISENK